MKTPLSTHLEVWGFERDSVIFADGSLGLALKFSPLDPSCWDDDRSNSFSTRVSQFLNSLPVGLSIQFVQDIVSGNSETLESHLKLADGSKNEIAIELCKERVAHLRELDRAGALPVYRAKLFVRKMPLRALMDRPQLFSRERKFEAIAEERLKHELHQLERVKDSILQGLLSLGINASPFKSDELAVLLYEQWNPSRRLPLASYDPEDIRSSLLFSDVGVSDEGFVIGSRHFRLLSLKILPDQTYSTMASTLSDLPFRSRLFLSIHVPDQMKEIEVLKTQRRIAYSMVVGKKTGVSDIESSAKLQDLETLLSEMIADGQKVFHAALNVLVQSDDESELEAQVDQVLAKFRELGGAEGMQETIAAYDIFRRLALPNARCSERIKKVKTTNLADFAPLYGPWMGHAIPRILFRSRSGGLLKVDPFDSASLSNANQLISGASGSGKSALTTFLTLQMLKESPKACIFIDVGGSYKKLCDNLGGQYLALGTDESIALNPFDLNAGETKPGPQKIKFLLGMVEIMTKEDGAGRLPKLIQSEIESAIEMAYASSSSPRLSTLRDILLEHQDIEIRSLGKILNSWCGETLYGRFLDRPTTVVLKNEIIAFDLKGLESHQDLQAICFYLITDLVWRVVQQEPARMKFLVFDECWRIMRKEGASIDFMEEIFRTFRKYNASALALTQAASDFLNSRIASALLSTCAIKWILPQGQNEFAKMKEAFGLNDSEIGLIQSLRQKKGEYSEAFLVAGDDNRTVAVIEPTPMELWIATTDPRDLAKIEGYRRENPHLSQFEALRYLAREFPHGAARA